ncbi:MAG: NTP transferase domain-containing protein [Bacteroidales bacterium]|nr:NTP transferase domain-containing protein [Bacteroidales bacterium]
MLCNIYEKQPSPVIILAAGLSERMKSPKLFLKWDNSVTFVEHIIDTYKKIGSPIILIVNKFDFPETSLFLSPYEPLTVIENTIPEIGRFHSIKLGISALKSTDSCFIQNIDNPFSDEITLLKLKKKIKSNSYVVPTFNKKAGHPVLIAKELIEAIKSINSSDFNFKDFLETYNRIECPVENEKIMININSKEDYIKAGFETKLN